MTEFTLTIVCEECLRKPELLFSRHMYAQRSWLVHVRCHEIERLVEVTHTQCQQGSVTLGQLANAFETPKLEEYYQRHECEALELMTIASAIRSVAPFQTENKDYQGAGQFRQRMPDMALGQESAPPIVRVHDIDVHALVALRSRWRR